MKIASIKKINGIGSFASFQNGGSKRFEKITLIFGYNTHGKSTLADIFQSLKDSDPEIIKNRATIPGPTTAKVELSIEENNAETPLIFSQTWPANNLSSRLEIFGSDFIYKNLFSGLQIERENKQNLTRFILGESGVAIANQIESLKKDYGNRNSALKNKRLFLGKDKNSDDVLEFINLQVDKSELEVISKEIHTKETQHTQDKEKLEEPSKIKELTSPEKYELPDIKILYSISALNKALIKSYADIESDTLLAFQNHVNQDVTSPLGAEPWIKQGLSLCKKDGNCPFCAQKLGNAKELMEVYFKYFNQAYSEHVAKIEFTLTSEIKALKSMVFSEKQKLQSSLLNLQTFKNLISSEEFTNKLSKLQTLTTELNEDNLNKEKNNAINGFEEKSENKIRKPYEALEYLNVDNLFNSLNDYCNQLFGIQKLIDELLLDIQSFQKSFNNVEQKKRDLELLQNDINKLKLKKSRIELDTECAEYLKEHNELETMRTETIPTLQVKLAEEQSEYLDKYFSEIDKLFKRFGSKDFSLEKKEENLGHAPVYSFLVKFKGKEIPSSNLHKVFSDSDRRALALSIFWAKLHLMPEQEKKETVIILDDPVTSFDEKRLTLTISLFKDDLPSLGQLIVLTHYPIFIKRFCETTKSASLTYKMLQIIKGDTTSSLEECDNKDFVMGDYEKLCIELFDFVNRRRQLIDENRPRKFLENNLQTVFMYQINENNIDTGNLEKLIDGLEENSIISSTSKQKLHGYRTTLNPGSHIFTADNPEDLRSYIEEMLQFLYSLDFRNDE